MLNSFFCFEFSGIMPGFDPFLLFRVLRHRVRIFLIFLNIVSEHRLSFPTSCPDFPHLPRHHVRALLIFSGKVSNFHYLFRHLDRIFLIFLSIMSKHRLSFWHRVRLSPIFTGIVSRSLIFPGIVLGFLLVLKSW